MTVSLSQKSLFEPMKSIDAAAIAGASGAFIAIQDDPTTPLVASALQQTSRWYMVQNLTDEDIFFSFFPNNTNSNTIRQTTEFMLPANGQLVIDGTANGTDTQPFGFSKGMSLFARGNPSTGSVYVSSIYGYTNPGY